MSTVNVNDDIDWDHISSESIQIPSPGVTRQRRKGLALDQDDFTDLIKIRQKLRKEEDTSDDVPIQSQKKGQPIGLITIIIVFAILTLAHIAAACYLFVTPAKWEHPQECLTPNCKRMSTWLKVAMDKSVDPCDNFHEYVCGRWLKKQNADKVNSFIVRSIPFQYEGNEKLGKFLQRVKTFPLNQILPYYRSCIFQRRRNTHHFAPFINLLKDLNLLHLEQGERDPPSNIARLMIHIFKRTNKMHFIEIADHLEGNFILVRLPIPEKEIQDTKPKIYAETMKNILNLLKRELFIDSSEIDTIVYLVMRFEAELATIKLKGTEFLFGFPHNLNSSVHQPAQFHSNYDERTAIFQWADLLDEMFAVRENPTGEPPVILFNYYSSFKSQEDRFYTLLMEQLLRNTPYYTLFHYFRWSLLKLYGFDLTSDLQLLMKKIFSWRGPNQAEMCFRSLFTHMSALAGDRYFRDMDDSKSNDQRVKNLTTFLQSSILKLAEETLSPDLFGHFEKSMLRTVMTEPNVEHVSHLMPTFFKGLNMSSEFYFENVLQTDALRARNQIKKILGVVPFERWPSMSNSLSDVTVTVQQDLGGQKRSLSIPFGALDEPFFGHDLPVMNFGGLGFWMITFYMMSYESSDLATDILDYRKTVQDNPLNIRQTAEAFTRFDCIYSSQGTLEVKQIPGVKLNQYSLISDYDNVADVMAVEMISKIVDKYMNDSSLFPKFQILPGFEHYNPSQLLFHTIARQTCRANTKEQLMHLLKYGPTPFQLRINGAFRLIDNFAKAWQCPKAAFMNPAKKCEFFTGTNHSYTPYSNTSNL